MRHRTTQERCGPMRYFESGSINATVDMTGSGKSLTNHAFVFSSRIPIVRITVTRYRLIALVND